MGQKATLLDPITSPLIYINAQLSSHPGRCSNVQPRVSLRHRLRDALLRRRWLHPRRIADTVFRQARLCLPGPKVFCRCRPNREQDSHCGRVSRLLDQCSSDNSQNYRELEFSNVIGSPLFPVCLTGCSISVTEAELAALRVVGGAVLSVRTPQ